MRLSVGALAEIAEYLDAPDPASLGLRLRGLTAQDARVLVTALLRPTGAHEVVLDKADSVLLDLLPDAALCIRTALS